MSTPSEITPVQTELTSPRTPVPASHHGKYWIEDWRPEDPVFWEEKGAAIAKRNLFYSVTSEHIGFSVWSLWSVLVLFLGPAYGYNPSQKFLLTAVPTLVGAVLRIPYTFAVAKFGGRNWTVISAALLLIPTIMIAIVLKPGVAFETLLVVSMFAGVGGGNFASSMANINAYYPDRLKGWALGINAGGGNLGVAAVQLVGLFVLAVFGAGSPGLVAGIYIPLIVVAALGSALFMDNLTMASNARGAIREVMTHRETWIVSLLYIGTFGSFIGFGFAFGQVLLVQFPQDFPMPVKAAALTFLGPLLGSFIRPVGGALADRYKGSVVSALNFVAMAVGALLGWAFGSWGIGLLVGAIVGIPLAVFVVYKVYAGSPT